MTNFVMVVGHMLLRPVQHLKPLHRSLYQYTDSKLLMHCGLTPVRRNVICVRWRAKKSFDSPVAVYLKSIGVPVGHKYDKRSASLGTFTYANFDLDQTKRVISTLRQLGFSERAVIEMVWSRPYILRVEPTDLRRRFRTLKENLAVPLNFSDQELKTLLEKQAYVLGSGHAPHGIRQKLVYLSTLGLSLEDMRTISKMDARFTLVDINDNIKNTVNTLCHLGINRTEVGHVIRRAPGIIGNVTENIRPKLTFFLHDLHFSRPELVEAIIRLPALLRYRTAGVKLKFDIMKEAGLSEELIRNSPVVFSYSTENVYNRFLFMKSTKIRQEDHMKPQSLLTVPIEMILKRHKLSMELYEDFVTKNIENFSETKKSGIVIVEY